MKKTQSAKTGKAQNYGGVIKKYRRYLPVTNLTPIISLNEGNTPLVYAGHLSRLIGKSCVGSPQPDVSIQKPVETSRW